MARTFQDTAKHLIKILRQGGKTANDIADLWLTRRNEVIESIEKLMGQSKNQSIIESSIHKQLAALTKETNDLMTANGMIAGTFQAESSAKFIELLGVTGNKVYKVTDAFVRASFKTPMPSANLAVNDLLRGQMASMDVSLVNITRQARASGATVDSIAKAIELSVGSLGDPAIRRKANALGRTAISQVANAVRYAALDAESEVDRVLYVGTLDHRTSDICKTLDGTIYKKSEARVPPLHVSCRSTLVPILKGESVSDVKNQLQRPAVEPKSVDQLNAKGLYTRGGRIRKPSTSSQSPLKGVVKEKYLNYEQWLKTQSATYQKAILGPSAYSTFRSSGNLSTALGVAA